MKKRVFIIHGWGGSSEGGCIPWLKQEMEKQGFEVIAPQMPNTEEPVIEEWVGHLSELVGVPDEQTYFVGHSIGCQAILRYLQTVDTKVGGALFIAAWMTLENLEGDEIAIAKPWIEEPISFEKLKEITDYYTVILSDNDPFGGFEYNKKIFSERLNAKIIVINGAGHIEMSELPIALGELLEITNKTTPQ